jgi:hypothetical protein
VIGARVREANEEVHIVKRMKQAGKPGHEFLILGVGSDSNRFWIRMERVASRDAAALAFSLKLVSSIIPANDTVSVRANCDSCVAHLWNTSSGLGGED